MHSTPLISIIIPTFNEEKYIAVCLDSILEADYAQEKMEVFVVDGMSEDSTREIVQEYHRKYPFIHVVVNQQRHTPIGMNLGIQASSGDYVFVLSAHAHYDAVYFKDLIENIVKLNADCVGGVLITDVKNKNKRSSSIKEVLMHKFGVGNVLFRTGCNEVTEIDTVAFGCYRRSTFEKYGLFDEKLIRNQDIELNKRIINAGGKIYLIPDVQCTYYARENFKDLAKNQYQNGYWNMLTAYYTKTLSSLNLRHFVPLLFVLSLLFPLLFSLLFSKVLWISFVSLLSYLSLVIIISIKLKNSSNSICYLIMSFLTLHLSYGIGSLMGILFVIKKMIKGEK
ncbi:MAG: glycosyltransferase family 2 protein [Epsilonproteobacteria bacterium]|nr:glycosyltransferase family 2 protein [Campylobacterota bacterium]